MTTPVTSTMAEQSADTTTSPQDLLDRRRQETLQFKESTDEDSLTDSDIPVLTSPISGNNTSDFDSTPISKVYNQHHHQRHHHPDRRGSLDPSMVAVHGSVPSSPVLRAFKAETLRALRDVIPETTLNGRHWNLPERKRSDTQDKKTDPVVIMERDHAKVDGEKGSLGSESPAGATGFPSASTPAIQNGRVIAFNIDNVMAQYYRALCDECNATYGTDLTMYARI